jgi:hypothetical protein
VVEFDVHLVVSPGDFRLPLCLLLLLAFEGGTDEVLPAWGGVVDDAGESLGVVVAEEVAAEGEVVGGGVVLLDDHQVSLRERVGEDSVQIGVAKATALTGGSLIHLLEGRLYHQQVISFIL